MDRCYRHSVLPEDNFNKNVSVGLLVIMTATDLRPGSSVQPTAPEAPYAAGECCVPSRPPALRWTRPGKKAGGLLAWTEWLWVFLAVSLALPFCHHPVGQMPPMWIENERAWFQKNLGQRRSPCKLCFACVRDPRSVIVSQKALSETPMVLKATCGPLMLQTGASLWRRERKMDSRWRDRWLAGPGWCWEGRAMCTETAG